MKEPSHEDPTVSIKEPPVYSQEELVRLYDKLKRFSSISPTWLFFGSLKYPGYLNLQTRWYLMDFKSRLLGRIQTLEESHCFPGALLNLIDVYKLMYDTPCDQLPLFINSPSHIIQYIAKWRLEIGK